MSLNLVYTAGAVQQYIHTCPFPRKIESNSSAALPPRLPAFSTAVQSRSSESRGRLLLCLPRQVKPRVCCRLAVCLEKLADREDTPRVYARAPNYRNVCVHLKREGEATVLLLYAWPENCGRRADNTTEPPPPMVPAGDPRNTINSKLRPPQTLVQGRASDSCAHTHTHRDTNT